MDMTLINKREYMYYQMHTVHYLKRPLNIDQTTQPSSIGGLHGDQTFPLHGLQKAILVD